ncbi:MAG: DNA polymerase III subunit gamma/tau, partial [Gammaproteobacteria bacterium]|nr:DNA polymerase III subunit gamma/tau [Gammaproteobacteria bacterium]
DGAQSLYGTAQSDANISEARAEALQLALDANSTSSAALRDVEGALGSLGDLIEIDAASRTKVEDTRDLLDNVQYAPTVGRFKVYLIDEVHMLSTHSFNALLKTLEEPPSHVKFLLATTDPQKLPVTVLSRCLQYHLKPLPASVLLAHLIQIAEAESIPFEKSALELIAKVSKGSARDALSILDQAIADGEGQIGLECVKTMLGCVDEDWVIALARALLNQNADQLFKVAHQIQSQSIDLEELLNRLARFWQQCALSQVVALTESEFDPANLKEFASQLDPSELQLKYQICIRAKADLALAPDLESGFEMALLRMLAFRVESPSMPMPPQTRAKSIPLSAKPAASIKAVAPSKPVSIDAPSAPEKSIPMAKPSVGADSFSIPNWEELIEHLPLQGMTKQLARHTTLKNVHDHKVELIISSQHESLLSEGIVRRLAASLTAHFGRELKLSIQVGEAGIDTPAQSMERQQKERAEAAKMTIFNDHRIKEIQQAFDAHVDEESIKPLEIGVKAK